MFSSNSLRKVAILAKFDVLELNLALRQDTSDGLAPRDNSCSIHTRTERLIEVINLFFHKIL